MQLLGAHSHFLLSNLDRFFAAMTLTAPCAISADQDPISTGGRLPIQVGLAAGTNKASLVKNLRSYNQMGTVNRALTSGALLHMDDWLILDF